MRGIIRLFVTPTDQRVNVSWRRSNGRHVGLISRLVRPRKTWQDMKTDQWQLFLFIYLFIYFIFLRIFVVLLRNICAAAACYNAVSALTRNHRLFFSFLFTRVVFVLVWVCFALIHQVIVSIWTACFIRSGRRSWPSSAPAFLINVAGRRCSFTLIIRPLSDPSLTVLFALVGYCVLAYFIFTSVVDLMCVQFHPIRATKPNYYSFFGSY